MPWLDNNVAAWMQANWGYVLSAEVSLKNLSQCLIKICQDLASCLILAFRNSSDMSPKLTILEVIIYIYDIIKYQHAAKEVFTT